MGNILRFFLPSWSPRPDLPAKQIDSTQLAFRAVKKGDVNSLQALMGDMTLQDIVDPRTGKTLLHAAMERGSQNCVRFLISIGCDLAKGDHSRETPLHVACMNDRLENLMAALEVEKEVDLDIRDMWHRTLLLKAMVYGSERVLQFLLQRQVELDAQDVFHFSVVHIAVSRKRRDLLHELARRGANLNLLNKHGHSPLSLAIAILDPAMVKELLILGASTSCPSSQLPSITAIREFVHRSETGTVCRQSEEILHLMLAAHGYLLHADQPNVFQRVLYTAGLHRYLPLLHKMLVCSDSLCDDLPRESFSSSQGNAGAKSCTALKLFDLARRTVREALMSSGHNVMWAVERLGSCSGVPPAVKGLLLLKDCDFKDFPFQG